MKIVGNLKQDGIPSPDNPVKIKNETVLIITDKEGNKKEMPFKYEKILKEGDKIEKINGEWCLVRRKSMNNIEILEMQLKKIKDFCKDNNNYYPEELPYYMFWNGKQAEIVENLIQEYKELKEKVNRQQEQLNIANKKILAQKGQLKVVNNSYIPKSKVKEKIEGLEKLKHRNIKRDFDTVYKDGYFTGGIDCLQELLEEGE